MVLCVKVKIRDAQKVKRFIIDNSLFDDEHSLKKVEKHIFFPLSKRGTIKKNFPGITFENIECPKRRSKKSSLKNAVLKDLSKEESAFLRRAFDITGYIAILEIPPELEKKEKLIAENLLKLQKNITTVLKKAGIHGTEFRTQKMKYLAGKKTKETIHKEHGARIKLDVEKVYFSPRLSTERKRVAGQVKKGESILVMFSGCAPYPCVISRNSRAKDIVGVEKNPIGYKYGVENIKLNKTENVKLYNGDVRDIVPKLKKKFDRIIMPLPKEANDFLDIALDVSKPGTLFNFYAFEELDNFKNAHKIIKEECKKKNMKCRILRTVKCGQHAPRTYRICVDFKVV